MYGKLFEQIKIGTMELKNRLVVPAMSTLFANSDGSCTEKFIAYHEAKAKGGWGLIVTEYYGVSPTVGFFPRLFGLWDDELIANHRKLTDRVHAAGAKIAAQINHAGRQTCSAITGVHPVAPSAIRDPTMPETPKALTHGEIREIVEQFGDTALAVKKAGFDGVELYGAHGYLISQFLSRFSNKRTDEYGGPIEDRCRFVVEVIQNIRSKVGEGYPILIRLSTEEFVPGGLTISETKVIAMILERAGIDAIDCSQGIYFTSQYIIPPSTIPHAVFVNNAEEIKKVVKIPVIAAGRINDPNIALSVLLSGKADLIAMGRASLADPQLPNKIKAGNIDDILYCIGCVQGCIGENNRGNKMHCLVNPLTAREDEFEITPAVKKKKIVVAGGGVTGCEAAIIAAQRGHEVTLYEMNDDVGGQWALAAVPPGKTEFLTLIKWQKRQLGKLGVKVVLNTECTIQIIEDEKPDTVIVATGSRQSVPPIKGLNESNVVLANDVLKGESEVGKNVLIIGGGLVGAETAEHLALYGSNVTIIEMLDEIIKDCERESKFVLLENLKKHNVAVYSSARLMEIQTDTAIFHHNGEEKTLKGIDTFVVAVGSRPVNELVAPLVALGIPVVVAGDASGVKNGLHNVNEGFMTGLTI